MNENRIGRVISVDSFRIFIKLDEDLKGLYKSGYDDIYEVARINSYLIIPVGADKIVAMVTRVKSIDETELSKERETIFLTKSARYLVATMIGTIEDNKRYIQGVYNYPILDNPVWYVTRQDLDKIFDQQKKSEINFERDYYLPIGSSPLFLDYKVKINPDRFFGKHAAILGNTGSGKSCTLTSILHSLFEFSYNGKDLKSAHIIIFDTNGEYKQAFFGNEESEISPFKKLELINPFHIDQKGMKVPYWFMSFDDFEYLFEPSAGTQAPILKRAIGLAKNEEEVKKKEAFSQVVISTISRIVDLCQENDKQSNDELKQLLFENFKYLKHIPELSNCLDFNLEDRIKRVWVENYNRYFYNDGKEPINIEFKEELSKEFKRVLNENTQVVETEKISLSKNIDLPLWFNFKELMITYIDKAIDEQEFSGNRVREFVSTLRLRLQSYLSDQRIADPLMLDQHEDLPESLVKFLAFVLGDYCKIYNNEGKDPFSSFYNQNSSKDDGNKKPSQVTIIDMSLLSYDVLETVTGMVGRLILDFVSRFDSEIRGKMPIVLALEEAQNYIPEKNKRDKESISKKVFERIAREGRKYGISLVVSSQRPSELSKTVLSQCNSFIIHRLQNPEDQNYVRQLVSSANEDVLAQLPILPQQHAIIMGDAVRTPAQVKIRTVSPTPNSNNPKFIENWLEDSNDDFPNYKVIVEKWQKGQRGEERKEQ